MHRRRRERWQAHGDVFRALRCRVADPFAFVRDDGGAGGDFERAGVRLDAEQAAEDDGEFVELGRLAGFDPAGGARHARDAEGVGLRVHATDELLDFLRRLPGGGDEGRGGKQSRHGEISLTADYADGADSF